MYTANAMQYISDLVMTSSHMTGHPQVAHLIACPSDILPTVWHAQAPSHLQVSARPCMHANLQHHCA
jgi:hypothetical protein